jgi:hypothetical protein
LDTNYKKLDEAVDKLLRENNTLKQYVDKFKYKMLESYFDKNLTKSEKFGNIIDVSELNGFNFKEIVHWAKNKY